MEGRKGYGCVDARCTGSGQAGALGPTEATHIEV